MRLVYRTGGGQGHGERRGLRSEDREKRPCSEVSAVATLIGPRRAPPAETSPPSERDEICSLRCRVSIFAGSYDSGNRFILS